MISVSLLAAEDAEVATAKSPALNSSASEFSSIHPDDLDFTHQSLPILLEPISSELLGL